MHLPSAPFSIDCVGCGNMFARFAGKYPAVNLPIRRFLFTSSTSKILDAVLAGKMLGLLIAMDLWKSAVGCCRRSCGKDGVVHFNAVEEPYINILEMKDFVC